MSEKLEALLQAVIDAETDTSYCNASESLAEAAPQILALIKSRTPAPEGESCPHDAYETDTADQPVRCVNCGASLASLAAPVVPVGVRERVLDELLTWIDAMTEKHGNPVGTDYEQGVNDQGFRIRGKVAAIIAALRPTDTGANHD